MDVILDTSDKQYRAEDEIVEQGQVLIASRRRFLTAILIAVIGAPVGAFLCSFGYLGIIMLLEAVFVPPLHSPANYGQFGFLVILFGFVGLFFGASFGLIPYTRFLSWLPYFLLISLFAVSGEVATNFDLTEVASAAMIVVGIVIVTMAATVSFFLRRREASRN